MRQQIHDHFREAQCMVVILEKPLAFVVKIAKNLGGERGEGRCVLHRSEAARAQ
jgi:hypothetical protein